MSHCLILQQYNDFYIGADSAGSMKINDSFYRISNNMQKIFRLGSDIYFCSGISNNVNLCNKWIYENNCYSIDIEKLKNFLKCTFNNVTNEKCFDIEFLICRIENGVSKVYHLAQYNNFDIVCYCGIKNQINIICGGCKTTESFELTKEIIRCGDVSQIYSTVFNKLSDERIGGTLSVYHNNNIFYVAQIDNVQIDTHLVLSDAVVSGYISGSRIEGGSLQIGTGDGNYFSVSEDGSVTIKSGGEEKYASKDAIKTIDNAYRFHVVLSYNNSTVFSDIHDTCTITCDVYDYDTCITDKIKSNGAKFSWRRVSGATDDDKWNSDHANQSSNTIKITTDYFNNQAQFSCTVDFDESKLS